ncbi:MAG: hypothetical protein M1820_002341 [Bogoriella megaspora]|nr:MAG: hypothetical protein M1820_002341 [Bogoriella megaspora]
MSTTERYSKPLIHPRRVDTITCHRTRPDSNIEEYLVKWKGQWAPERVPHSWHTLDELKLCLDQVQAYVEQQQVTQMHTHQKAKLTTTFSLIRVGTSGFSLKRKSPDDHIYRSSPASRSSLSPSISSNSSRATSGKSVARSRDTKSYNGKPIVRDGWIEIDQSTDMGFAQIDSSILPMYDMLTEAALPHSRVTSAINMIRQEFMNRLGQIHSANEDASVTMANTIDRSSPPLSFKFVNESILRNGVVKLDAAAIEGCRRCKPDMGSGIGCQYTKWCDCLEFARVDEERLDEATRPKYQRWLDSGGSEGSPFDFPKRFPYRIDKRFGQLLNGFYLDSRHPIYECNDKCRCGPGCKNRLVQWGRNIPLQIFKTVDRGWGLRCPKDLRKGQFIDTYRGEIITDDEAKQREEQTGPGKDSYLYSLDKFQDDHGLEEKDMFVVDGQFMGGPSRFINHSCQPNLRQYTVSYNKYDVRVYDIAFFACEDIPAYTELTFDYMDKDDDEGDMDEIPIGSQGRANPEDEKDGAKPVECRCGAARCRRWLWM